ncbi:hypothetical protein JRO89_XS04G0209400 [Xanthoceras sorbifolium]|uniref:Retrotransposon Copia-like N-terminal domain-containing protein n=1 Tax=Xanthoceras sorbifolium TaxID=99658 RepID=A0ABQ8I677_9ROSI|nr:hypothetical protein JRO89_XS04G0209400 [Xanthoceras sorbifolium]
MSTPTEKEKDPKSSSSSSSFMDPKAMIKALSAKNKAGFVDGSIPKPSSADSTLDLWKRCDDMVASWIMNAIILELAEDAIYTETAGDL